MILFITNRNLVVDTLYVASQSIEIVAVFSFFFLKEDIGPFLSGVMGNVKPSRKKSVYK